MTNEPLPQDLAPLVLGYGVGTVIYPDRGTSRAGRRESLPEKRLDELAEAGWLTKHVRGFGGEDGEEELEVEQEEDGTWWFTDYGEECPPNRIVVSYLSTEKTHETFEARAASLAKHSAHLMERVGEALSLAELIQSPEAVVRLELCAKILSCKGDLRTAAAAQSFRRTLELMDQ